MLEYHQMLDELKVVANDMQLTKQRLKLQEETRRRKQRAVRQQVEEKTASSAADARDAANTVRRGKWSNSPPSGDDNGATDDSARRVCERSYCTCVYLPVLCSLCVVGCV